MTVYVTHSNREFSDHTSWSEIMIFSRALEEHGIDVRVAHEHKDLGSMHHTDTLVLFCSGMPKPEISAIANCHRTIVVVQDLSWQTVVPRHDVLLTGCMIHNNPRIRRALKSIGVDTTTRKMRSFPFGAVGALDQTNRQNLERGADQYDAIYSLRLEFSLDWSRDIAYLGSAKDDRILQIAKLLGSRGHLYDRLLWIGNITHKYLGDMVEDERIANRIYRHGWIRPNMSVGLYRENLVQHLVVADKMSLLELDYNRPYEMSMAGAKRINVTGTDKAVESFKQTYPWLGNDRKAQTHAQKMVENIDWSMFE